MAFNLFHLGGHQYTPMLPPITEHEAFDSNWQPPDHEPEPKRLRGLHRCDLCGKSYTQKKSLLVHYRSPDHCQLAGLPVPDLSCPRCPHLLPFAREDNLQRHIKEVHEGVKRRPQNNALSPSLSVLRSGLSFNRTSAFLEVDVIRDETGGGSLKVGNEGHTTLPPSHDNPPSCSASGSAVSGTLSTFSSSDTSPTTCTSFVNRSAEHCARTFSRTQTVSQVDERSVHPLQELLKTHIVGSAAGSDNASLKSISTVGSVFSTFTAHIPFRSGWRAVGDKALDAVKRNPRPVPLQFVKPCPLCGKELNEDVRYRLQVNDTHKKQETVSRKKSWKQAAGDGQKVVDHLDVHLQEMTNPAWEISCQQCEVPFVHVKDLEWHQTMASSYGHCGFCDYPKQQCHGHHPPSDDPALHTHHLEFTTKLRSWEHSQLKDFLQYIEDFSKGLVRTNAPPYEGQTDTGPYKGTSAAFRRSTGSLFSVRTRSTGFTRRSAPEYIRYRPETNQDQSSTQAATIRSSSHEYIHAALTRAVRDGNHASVRLLLDLDVDEQSKMFSDWRFYRLQAIASDNHDFGMLLMLLEFDQACGRETLRDTALVDLMWKLSKNSNHRFLTDLQPTAESALGACIAIFLANGSEIHAFRLASSRTLIRCLQRPPVLRGMLEIKHLYLGSKIMETVMCLAAYYSCHDVVVALLDAGVDVNSSSSKAPAFLDVDDQFPSEGSALSLAVARNHRQMIISLLRYGAYVDDMILAFLKSCGRLDEFELLQDCARDIVLRSQAISSSS